MQFETFCSLNICNLCLYSGAKILKWGYLLFLTLLEGLNSENLIIWNFLNIFWMNQNVNIFSLVITKSSQLSEDVLINMAITFALLLFIQKINRSLHVKWTHLLIPFWYFLAIIKKKRKKFSLWLDVTCR